MQDLTGFWGGEYTTPGNERVTIYSSNSYAVDPATNQRWADFLGRLMHGPELSRVTIYLATPSEVDRLCHGEADLLHYVLGCYGSDTIIAAGEDTGLASAEAVLAHEYGHHIAANRSNAPWQALEWGPKRWASAMNICAMARAHLVFPGDESLLYRLNPGEASPRPTAGRRSARLGTRSEPGACSTRCSIPGMTQSRRLRTTCSRPGQEIA